MASGMSCIKKKLGRERRTQEISEGELMPDWKTFADISANYRFKPEDLSMSITRL
jgi:hypothetical protein